MNKFNILLFHTSLKKRESVAAGNISHFNFIPLQKTLSVKNQQMMFQLEIGRLSYIFSHTDENASHLKYKKGRAIFLEISK